MNTIAPFLLLMLSTQLSSYQPAFSTDVYARTGSRGANCSGSGICSISANGGQALPSEGYNAKLGYDDQGRLFLEFRYVDLPDEVIATQFNTDAFEMQSDCPVPANVLQAIIPTSSERVLKSGFYPLSKTSQSVKVTFN